MSSDREQVCLECWRDFTQDFLHLDCTGKHVVSKAEAAELREWVTGRYECAISTGQVTCEGSHDNWLNIRPCPTCKAAL